MVFLQTTEDQIWLVFHVIWVLNYFASLNVYYLKHLLQPGTYTQAPKWDWKSFGEGLKSLSPAP